ncbi:MAG: hypothetical protein AAGC56_07855 [Pseudomonadota bacterium]
MTIVRLVGAFLIAAAATYALAVAFYTRQVVAAQVAIGAEYEPDQIAAAFAQNFTGLASGYGLAVAGGLAIAFAVAAGLKRVLRPLAPIAYPLAGAAALYATITLIDRQFPGVGAIGGARTPLGLALQCLAGAVGGVVFTLLRPRGR